MVWLEDPLTGDMPHRGVIEEEDELLAQELAPQYGAKPILEVSGDDQLCNEVSH
jgi:hypothetical protein